MPRWDGDGADAVRLQPGRRTPSRDDARRRRSGSSPEQVRVISPHVGGGFGSKGIRPPATVIARRDGRARSSAGRSSSSLTRQQMFALVGYRTPTIQRLRLGADADGRLTAIGHEVVEQTSTISEFAEQTARRHPRDVRRAEPRARRTGWPASTCRPPS